MVINDLNVIRITALPKKADAPLVIYSDAVAASALSAKLFQVIRGRHSQGIQFTSGIKHHELSPGLLGDVMRYPPRNFTLENLFSILAFKALDHRDSIPHGIVNVKRY